MDLAVCMLFFHPPSQFLPSWLREIDSVAGEQELVGVGPANTVTRQACLRGVHGVKCRH